MGTQEFKDDALPSKKEQYRVVSPFDFNYESPKKLIKEIASAKSKYQFAENQSPNEINFIEELKVVNNVGGDSTEPLQIKTIVKTNENNFDSEKN